MTLHSLALHRARKRLETFCTTHTFPGNNAPHWCLSEEDGALVIRRCADALPVLRLAVQDDVWALAVPDSRGGWRAYPPLPWARTFDAVLAELNQAPLHIHW